ncbi:MAG: hypothetical protein HY586_03810, partial [Candidatus Omnitrophica bacterium]|nr:hypothetical protein [Candidatus Omnitrophota bacterium]
LDIPDLRWMPIDLLLNDKETLKSILENGKKVTVMSYPVIIPSLEHLLAMKFHAVKGNYQRRFYKDIPDILSLIEKNNVRIDSDSFRELCLKYGSQELYDEIKRFFEEHKK